MIPRVTYCTPEIASVGLTEAQAVERGHEVVIERLNFQGIGKANMLGEGGHREGRGRAGRRGRSSAST